MITEKKENKRKAKEKRQSDKFDIHVFNDSSFKYLPKKKLINSVFKVLDFEDADSASFNIVLIDDKSIKVINKKYLNHNSTTDVISFNLGDDIKSIEGEIYISVETAKKQSESFGVTLTNEILRLAIHGTLHLLGYDDNTDEKRKLMHNLENKYLLAKIERI